MAYYQAAGGDFGALEDKRAGRDDAALADLYAIQNDRAHADQAAGFYVAAVQGYAVADGYVVAEEQGIFVAHYVEDGAILNVGAGADADVVDVAADYRAGPDAGGWGDDYVADDYGGGVNVGGGGDFGALAAIGSDHCIPVIGAGLLKSRLGAGTGVPCPYMPSRVNWNDNIWAAGITRKRDTSRLVGKEVVKRI